MGLQENNYITQERLVAYFDILGYSEIIKSKQANDFINKIDEAIQQVKIAITKPADSPEGKIFEGCFKYRIYSDNFLIMLDNEVNTQGFLALTWVVKIIQNAFLVHHKLLLRGVIKKGNIFLNEDFVFGDVLVDLNRMEQQAEYPRIIIDKQIEDLIGVSENFTVRKDFDGYYCIEYMNHTGIIIESDVALHSMQERKQIIELVILNGHYENEKLSNSSYILSKEKIIRKYLWLIEAFNQTIPSQYIIPYELNLNQCIMRIELHIID